MPISKCVEQVTTGNVSFSESGCRLQVENGRNIQLKKVRVDSCLPITGKQCDYALLIEAEGENILIELKGSRFKDAVDQLENTYFWFRNNCQFPPTGCLVIMSNRCPSSSGKIQIIKDRFKRTTGLIIKTIRSGNKIKI